MTPLIKWIYVASTRSGPMSYDRLCVARLVINMGRVGGIERGTSRLGRWVAPKITVS